MVEADDRRWRLFIHQIAPRPASLRVEVGRRLQPPASDAGFDLGHARFVRPAAAGIDRPIAGIAMRHGDDGPWLREGGAVFEALHQSFARERQRGA